MEEHKGQILWVDDEIELLRPHIQFLKEKGYDVSTATNGEDAVALVRSTTFDLVFLDEMMPGMGGLRTLAEIKELHPALPVIMVTKNEEETLMEEAIGVKISDYLIKPVNPSQILLACKKFLEGKKIARAAISKDYTQEFSQISLALMSDPGYRDWVEIYARLVGWAMELDAHPELGLTQTLGDQIKESNLAFGKYVERHYRDWVEQDDGPSGALPRDRRPLRSPRAPDGQVRHACSSSTVSAWTSGWSWRQLLQEYFAITKEYYYQHPAHGDAVLEECHLQRVVPERPGSAVPRALGEERGRREQPEQVRTAVP